MDFVLFFDQASRSIRNLYVRTRARKTTRKAERSGPQPAPITVLTIIPPHYRLLHVYLMHSGDLCRGPPDSRCTMANARTCTAITSGSRPFSRAEQVGADGMVVDFAILKSHLRTIVADLDHKYINEIPFFKERASSSEWLAALLLRPA